MNKPSHNENAQGLTALWIFLAFLIWILVFRGYLSSQLALTSDAISYYDHTKFFVENLGRGVFPLWDPFWCNGSPNDFFLRRIGALNPFYLIILLLKSVGIPYTLSYLWFLAVYYWGGMIAFYLLAMRIYHDRFIAYGGYLILLFSALGTRLFDSYMMLVTMPLIWFFYFLVAFVQTPRKHLFLGMVLSFMILAGTYIPFYFLIILTFFIVLFALIYFDHLKGVLSNFFIFFKENRLLVFLTAAVLVLSFFPIITFFHDSSRGQVVLPVRHGDSGAGHALTVPLQTLDWGAVEDLLYSSYFADLRLFKFAVVYVPFFSVIIFALGLFGRLNRRTAFLFLLGLLLFCSIVPHGLPFYDFFYKHFLILKYFRNLHFFIWFFLIPLFVFLVLGHWKSFTEMIENNAHRKTFLFLTILAVHALILWFVIYRNDAILTTYVMVLLSLIFWSLIVLNLLKANAWGFALLTLTVLVQPLEAYHYFSLKAVPYMGHYNYDFSSASLNIKDNDEIKPENYSSAKWPLYYASAGYNFIYENVSNYALAKYLQHKFLLVDHLELVDQNSLNPSLLEQNFLKDENKAFILNEPGSVIRLDGNDPDPPMISQRLDNNSTGFKLLSFDADHVSLSINVPYEKFLVYNDSYDPYWQVSVDHHRTQLYDVDGAFKGVWIPAGTSIVEFHYGFWWQYAMNILLLIFAFMFLIGIICFAGLSLLKAEA